MLAANTSAGTFSSRLNHEIAANPVRNCVTVAAERQCRPREPGPALVYAQNLLFGYPRNPSDLSRSSVRLTGYSLSSTSLNQLRRMIVQQFSNLVNYIRAEPDIGIIPPSVLTPATGRAGRALP